MKVVNGPLLRQLRQAKGLHFLALSAAVDVDRRSLSSYEKSNPPNVDLIALVKLAEFYGRTVDDLLIEEALLETATPADAQAVAS